MNVLLLQNRLLRNIKDNWFYWSNAPYSKLTTGLILNFVYLVYNYSVKVYFAKFGDLFGMESFMLIVDCQLELNTWGCGRLLGPIMPQLTQALSVFNWTKST